MSVNIKTSIIKELKERANKALILCDKDDEIKAINKVLAIVDYIEIEHTKQKQKITNRVNKMRKINKNYSRPKKITK
jgi:hypothetical protein